MKIWGVVDAIEGDTVNVMADDGEIFTWVARLDGETTRYRSRSGREYLIRNGFITDIEATTTQLLCRVLKPIVEAPDPIKWDFCEDPLEPPEIPKPGELKTDWADPSHDPLEDLKLWIRRLEGKDAPTPASVFKPTDSDTELTVKMVDGSVRKYKVTKFDINTGEVTGMERVIPEFGGPPVVTPTKKPLELISKITVEGHVITPSEDDGLLVCDCSDWQTTYPICPHVAVAQVTGADEPLMQHKNPVKKLVTIPVLSGLAPQQMARVYLIPLKSKVSFAAVLHPEFAHAETDQCYLCNMDPTRLNNQVFDRTFIEPGILLGTVGPGDGRVALVRMVVAYSDSKQLRCLARSHKSLPEVVEAERRTMKVPKLKQHYHWTVMNLGYCPTCYIKRQEALAGSMIGRLDEK